MERLEISHNDIGERDRGVWRKYNPYNPYVPESEEKKVENLKVESLDDLFEDDPKDDLKNDDKKELKEEKVTATVGGIEEKNEPQIDLTSLNDEAPVLPQNEDDSYDLQKELEAKFDELFGPLDED